MHIERTTFGSITIDGKCYEHDVVIRLSGQMVKVMAELPWMEEKDIEVNVSGDVLTIKGEKKEGKEEKTRPSAPLWLVPAFFPHPGQRRCEQD